MFFNIGTGEMMLIAVALLIAVGPEQLPGLVRRVGTTVGQFRSMSDRLRADFTAGMAELDKATDVKTWTEIPALEFSADGSATDDTPTSSDDSVDDAADSPADDADAETVGDSETIDDAGEADSSESDPTASGTERDSGDVFDDQPEDTSEGMVAESEQ